MLNFCVCCSLTELTASGWRWTGRRPCCRASTWPTSRSPPPDTPKSWTKISRLCLLTSQKKCENNQTKYVFLIQTLKMCWSHIWDEECLVVVKDLWVLQKKCLTFPWGKSRLHSFGKSCNSSFSSLEINNVAPSCSFWTTPRFGVEVCAQKTPSPRFCQGNL